MTFFKKSLQSVLHFYRSPSGLCIGFILLLGMAGIWFDKAVASLGLFLFAVVLPYRLMREQQRPDKKVAASQQLTVRELATLNSSLNSSLTQFVQHLNDLESSVAAKSENLHKQIANSRHEINTLTEDLAHETAGLRLGQEASNYRQKGLLGERPQPFSRVIEKTVLDALLETWNNALNANFLHGHIEWLALHLQDRERSTLGRFATTLPDLVSRVLITRGALKPNTQILEIGTLFGLGSLLVHEATRPFCETLNTTVLDPFEGYYDRGQLDPPTGMPVNEESFTSNRRILGIPESEIRLLKGFSTDTVALEAASDRKYQVIVVDGDHSYQGVKNDVELYTPLLAEDGLLIIDDYGTDDWPDIFRYVNELVAEGTYELLGHFSRTAAIRPLR